MCYIYKLRNQIIILHVAVVVYIINPVKRPTSEIFFKRVLLNIGRALFMNFPEDNFTREKNKRVGVRKTNNSET